MSDIFGSGKSIIGKLHNKGNGFATEHSVSHEQCHENSHKNSAKIQGDHDKSSMFREKGKKCVDRQLCRAAHKRREQDGHFTVAFGGEGPACHNTGNRAAKTDEHGNDASSWQTDLSEQFIHNKGNPRHVAAVFQQWQEEKQRDYNRKET